MKPVELIEALKPDGDLDGYLEMRSDDEIRADIQALIGCEEETLRDKFAGKAMQGILAKSFGNNIIRDVVAKSYEYADAMLKERSK